MKKIRRALLSVSDKTGIIEFAKTLEKLDVDILSTGGTAKLLEQHGIKITEVGDYTGFPEMMDGRVKTLHPKIHGGLLGRRDKDIEVMQTHNIPPIDLVVVNLYPFKQTIEKADVTFADAIENIDIGGPTMLRSAAKNHNDVAVICDPNDYASITDMLSDNNGQLDFATRFALACKVFEHTAQYDGMIANHLGKINPDTQVVEAKLPKTINFQFHKAQEMRYGENPHQKAALYIENDYFNACVAHAQQLQGKELSYNNIADTDAALQCVKSFDQPACVIVKHANPCGVAQASNLHDAYQNAFACDPTSAFGGIIAFNRPLDASTAQAMVSQQFIEVVIAPEVSNEALAIFAQKKNVRVLACGYDKADDKNPLELKKIDGGLLVQDKDTGMISESDLQIVSTRKPTPTEIANLLFAWRVVKYVKSNAIVYAKNNMTVGIGAGQMSRVFSSKIAVAKAQDAKLELKDSAMASDAFFPFRDGIDTAAEQGVSCIIQPGGSIKDQEVIDAANEHNIAMIFTGVRHFRH